MEELPKYLVRPSDYHIFELDEYNKCYRSSSMITDCNGFRQHAQPHFTLENLTQNYDFFPIDESDIDIYNKKHQLYLDYSDWSFRSDGHGGCKGGTMDEYLISKGLKSQNRLKPCDCRSMATARRLNEQGIGFNEESIMLEPNVVVLKMTHTTIKIPMDRFKMFAEWYLTEQIIE